MEMGRRNFLGVMVGGIAATAAVRTWPFRVYSFPSEVVLPTASIIDQLNAVSQKYLDEAIADLIFAPSPRFSKLGRNADGTIGTYMDGISVENWS